jgi:electron transfer flavoprotein beta subunit
MTPNVVVCLKWVSHAGEPGDARFAGMSPADHAALELALQWAERCGGDLTAITVGPLPAESVLREALACGASNAIRVDASAATDSADVAAAIAAVAGAAEWIWCGDYSADNGSGSVPSFLAAARHASQALGVIDVSFAADHIVATRRIDGGRREILAVTAPAVISVEGATARLRRATLAAIRAAAIAPIVVVSATITAPTTQHTVHTYRPRARSLPTPSGADALDRVRSLTAAGAATAVHEVEVLPPPAAAARIVRALSDWGYL